MLAIDFSLRTMDSNEAITLSDYKGKPIMLTFWVSWCPDCRRDLQNKQLFYDSIDKEQLVFLTINVLGREVEEGAGEKFMKENGYTFPVLLDEGRKYYDLYECQGAPTTILINENGEIVARYGDKAPFSEIMIGLSQLIK